MAGNADITQFVATAFPERINRPRGALRFPFIDPGAGYGGILWDWDAYFCLLGLEAWSDSVAEVARGCVLNFLEHQREDGSIPYALSAGSRPAQAARPADGAINSAKPLMAQFALMAARYSGASDWLAKPYAGLARHCRHWEETQLSPCGLFTFRSHRGSGSDDHPAVYGRPFNSSADVFLNSLMVREYRAMAETARLAGHSGDAPAWTEKAERLCEALRTLNWDPLDGAYYNTDVARADPGPVNQEITWAVPLKFRSWTMVMPLWAGAAPPGHADRVVREHVLNPQELRAPHGLRSLARNEPAYEVVRGSNPSCWRGPIWIVANYLAWQSLRDYGYRAEAATLAGDVLAMLERDLDAHGCLHEYYHPETGAGLTHPGFLNWNTLAVRMLGSV